MAITTNKKPSNSKACKPYLPIALTVAATVALVTPAAGAAEWHVTPFLAVRGTYSDNIRLSPRAGEESDFVTDISPSVSISGNGPNFSLKTRYTFQQLNYANDNKGDSSFHKFDGTAQINLIKDLLSIDGTAAVNQQDVDFFGPSTLTSGNHTINPNRTTVRTATVSPYLHRRFRGVADGELRYTKTHVDTGSQALSNSDIDAMTVRVTSDPSARRLTWGLRHDAQRTEQANANSVESKSTTVDLRLMVTPQFYLTAGGGYEEFDYIVAPGEPDPQGSFYSGGFSWRPTERTSLGWSVGKHFYGTAFTLNSSVRNRYTAWQVTYDESVTSTPAQIALNSTASTANFLDQLFQSSISDPVLRQQAVERFIATNGLPPSINRTINYLTTQFYLQKAFRASLGMTGAKNSVVITLSDTLRTPQSLETSSVTSGDTRQRGASALWSSRLTGRTSATFSADHIRKELQTGSREERLTTYRIGLARQFQPKFNGGIELRHAKSAADAGLNDYQENAISAFISMQI